MRIATCLAQAMSFLSRQNASTPLAMLAKISFGPCGITWD